MTRKKTSLPAKATAVKPTGTAVIPAHAARKVLADPPAPDGAEIYSDDGVTLIRGHAYITRVGVIDTDEIYYDREVTPAGEGPWLGEADKIAWRDPATGYECIMLRDTMGGYLSGYVGVPPTHPLYGFDEKAVPDGIGIDVHGGLTYSKICQHGPTPDPRYIPVRNLRSHARRICHSPPVEMQRVPTSHATEYRVRDDDAWWFGFSCNHVFDLVPGDPRDRQRFLKAETGATYRDDAYVSGEIAYLAAQLHAIADGAPLPRREGDAPPPIGLNPKRL